MNNIVLDIKIQDELRNYLSQRGSSNNFKITNISLGDSDIDYDLSQNKDAITSFKSPFQSYGIKNKLTYNGGDNNVSGYIHIDIIKVDSDGSLQSYYKYPASVGFSSGIVEPTLNNSYDFSEIPFNSNTTLEGYVVFIKTLGYNLLPNTPISRIEETYTVNFIDTIPSDWELIEDNNNNSFFLAKPTSYAFENLKNQIKITGNISGFEKTLKYKI
jgi:hypothetical protein